jgi:hypothetical protein
VIDGANALHERRAIWPIVARRAAVPLTMLETVLINVREHRLRIEAREATSEPNSVSPWTAVVGMTYDPWDSTRYDERTVIDLTDTSSGLASALRVLADAIQTDPLRSVIHRRPPARPIAGERRVGH